jgi:hypothetical protein
MCNGILPSFGAYCPMCNPSPVGVAREQSLPSNPPPKINKMNKRVAWSLAIGLLMIGAALFAALLITGCTPAYVCPTIKTMPTAPNELVPESELRAEWVRRFGPLPSPACDPRMQWRVMTQKETNVACPLAQQYKDQGFTGSAGCLSYLGGRCPMATIVDASRDDAGLRAHELAHWLLQCSWIGTWSGNTHPPGITAEAYGDPFHSIQSVWGKGGYVQSAGGTER